jgi:YfiR/HmsC-like
MVVQGIGRTEHGLKNRQPVRLLLCWTLMFFCQGQLSAESLGMPVPEWHQMMIFLKVLTYDRTLNEELSDAVSIGILYRPGEPASKTNRDRVAAFLDENTYKTVSGRPFIYTSIPYGSPEELAAELAKHEIQVLYVTVGHDESLAAIAGVTRAQGVLTITGVPDFASRWLSVSLALRGEKPRIVVNLPASKAEQHEFNANLLRLCEVIR